MSYCEWGGLGGWVGEGRGGWVGGRVGFLPVWAEERGG